MQLQVIKPFPIPLIIIPIVVGILGGLIAAYFFTGGKMRWGKVLAGLKPLKTKELAKAREAAREKAVVKSTVKRPIRRRARGK
jgi:hypothetical protein